ncbi:MAG TPA: carbohydrate-binding domain-containing protein, partial [Polyangiaceae bacterium]|nr:carbohydrate-binding domain-containing protein [Polyangiaceae bacterium]
MKARTYGFVSAALVSAALATGCSAASTGDEEHSGVVVSQAVTYSPQAVPNNTSKRVFVHVMPWFEAKATQHGYSRLNVWGQHWTMANCTAETNGLLNRVCADNTPLIGPYSSSDPYVVEYHLLLMKYAGIDGISIDWPGTTPLWDFPDNKFNSEAYIQRLNDFGLNFLIVNEDRNYQSGVDNGRYGSVITGATNDLNCLKAGGSCGNMYFGHPKYERFNGVPLLATFGPITLTTGSQWASAYAGAGLNTASTYHIALWYQNNDLGDFNDGSFAWIWQDANPFLWHQQNYLNNYPYLSIKMASVFPGFDPYYARGGWPTDSQSQTIAANGTSTVSQLLDISLASNANYIQLNTWNDFGEATEFEPSVERGTSILETVQQKLGVPYGKSQLDLIKRLFDARVSARKSGDTSRQSQLDQASAYLAALNVSAATTVIDGTAPPPPPPQQPYPPGNPVPGTIQAENYDIGGEGVAFHDTSVANEGGAFRTAPGDSVDVEATSDVGGGYDVGWTNTGEWMAYTFTTSATARYDFKVRVASPGTGGQISLTLDSAALGSVQNVPNTGFWQTYTDLTIGTGQQITSGTHVLRVNVVAGGFNLNSITSSLSPATPTCGNGSCESGESCSTCPSDCGQCSTGQ